MTLELNKVTEQVGEMGQDLAARVRRRRKALPALRALLHQFANDRERLRALAESTQGQEARCALPCDEALDATFPAPESPSPATVLAADGSQIYPDPHGLALYYALNVGSLVYRHGSGQTPEAASDPRIAYAVDEAGDVLASERINARRDVAEMQKLADLAEAAAAAAADGKDGPTVALLDSTLGLRAWSSAIPQAEQEALQQRYAAQLDRIRLSGTALAGFLSRSRRSGVVGLLDLAKTDELGNPSSEPSLFLGLTDQMVWGDLRPGERSALFVEQGALPVYFFYLNTEPPDRPQAPGVETEPARIEIPEWVALSPNKLSLVHALVYDQCRINNGYPYALTRADELAIILNEEREALETMILQAMSRHGLPLPRMSPKEAQKRVARAPSRRRL